MKLGAHVTTGETRFAVRAPNATRMTLCLQDGSAERMLEMGREGELWHLAVPGDLAGCHYGYRADGLYDPTGGSWFDAAKLLVDPYAVELDRRFTMDRRLAQFGEDTGDIVPRGIVPLSSTFETPPPPCFMPGGLIYELNVRGFSLLHPDIPERLRGTVAALAHPAIIAHLKRLCVGAVELMPIVAWIDERHLAALGLRNAWGYNPVTMMALDPGLCPGGVEELRRTVAALRAEGIGVILDIVLNHTGESDIHGPTLSLRGLEPDAYARGPDGVLVNDTGCGNTLDFANRNVRELALATLRHFVGQCGVDGFRFDLAPVLARGPGFAADAPIFAEIAADPMLADRVLIAEPWDIGPGGYRLGAFPTNWLEWNDRFRDDVRRFWRGDGTVAELATRLAGSADIFGEQASRSVNFLAAHDGFTLADTVAYVERHNWANGEDNRDGHGENFSWNNGVEGPTDDAAVIELRRRDLSAMLATLFASAGTILLTAGDEFGRTQEGNNNAYAQDNAVSWIDWSQQDDELLENVYSFARWRFRLLPGLAQFPLGGEWQARGGLPMRPDDWDDIGSDFVSYQAGTYGFMIDRAARSATLRD